MSGSESTYKILERPLIGIFNDVLSILLIELLFCNGWDVNGSLSALVNI